MGPRTAGYRGHGDGFDQLHNHQLANRYRAAGPGRVTLTWELPQGGPRTSALAFGASRLAADAAPDPAMHGGSQAVVDAYRTGWRQDAASPSAPAGAAPPFYHNAYVSQLTSAQRHPGALL